MPSALSHVDVALLAPNVGEHALFIVKRDGDWAPEVLELRISAAEAPAGGADVCEVRSADILRAFGGSIAPPATGPEAPFTALPLRLGANPAWGLECLGAEGANGPEEAMIAQDATVASWHFAKASAIARARGAALANGAAVGARAAFLMARCAVAEKRNLDARRLAGEAVQLSRAANAPILLLHCRTLREVNELDEALAVTVRLEELGPESGVDAATVAAERVAIEESLHQRRLREEAAAAAAVVAEAERKAAEEKAKQQEGDAHNATMGNNHSQSNDIPPDDEFVDVDGFEDVVDETAL